MFECLKKRVKKCHKFIRGANIYSIYSFKILFIIHKGATLASSTSAMALVVFFGFESLEVWGFKYSKFWLALQ